MTIPDLAAALDTTEGAPRLRLLLHLRHLVAAEIAAERYRLAICDEMSMIEAAADLYSVEVDAILSDSRDRNTVRARHVACWLMWHQDYTYSHIGRTLGRDHTTAMYAVKAVEKDPAIRALARTLLDQLREVAA